MPVIIDPKAAPATISTWLGETRIVIDKELEARLPLPDLAPEDPIYVLATAMRYAVLGSGKRLRPALVIAACQACGGSIAQALPAAAAIEILHAYTLVHDDLPAMDDDDERRGRPTVHIQFDEATAILVGDALLTLSLSCAAELDDAQAAVTRLAERAGWRELLGGQMLDLGWQQTNKTPDLEGVERLHRGKTGALFAAACELGAIAANAAPKTRQAMADYGMAVGVAFQHADDLDDGDFPEQAALARSRRIELAQQASEHIRGLGEAGLLQDFAQWIGRA